MHAFITGASSGIGEALARAFAAEGYELTLVARRQAELERVAGTLGGRKNQILVADLGALDGIDALVDKAVAGLGPIDVLINNAGSQIVAATEGVPIADGEKLMVLNVFAPFRLTRKVLPAMLARGSGTIVDIASLSALTTPPGMFHYGASKAALATASESLRCEVKARGVHVVTVYPGPIKTAMADVAMQRYETAPPSTMPAGTTEVLARLVLRAVKRRHARVIYPGVYRLSRAMPGLSRWLTDKFSPVPKPF